MCIVKVGLTMVANANGEWIFFFKALYLKQSLEYEEKYHSCPALILPLNFAYI